MIILTIRDGALCALYEITRASRSTQEQEVLKTSPLCIQVQERLCSAPVPILQPHGTRGTSQKTFASLRLWWSNREGGPW
jgi:hypothetical protein